MVLVSPGQRRLNVLLVRSSGTRHRWTLPHDVLRSRETLDDAAARVCGSVLSPRPTFVRQVRAIETGRSDAAVTVGYVAASPDIDGQAAPGCTWVPVDETGPIPSYQRTLIEHAVQTLRRSDDPMLAFAMLPPHFTLTELQRVNEMICGRKLHKASFRRTVLSAKLLEPTDSRRVEGRGRPAQVFRFVGRGA